MESFLTPSTITFVLGIGGLIFTVYSYFRNPQIEADKRDIKFAEQMKALTESNELRFKTIQDNFSSLLLQSNNHIHTVDTKVDNLTGEVTKMGKEIVRLGTIIEERIPKQK